MEVENREDIIRIIREDEWMMSVLTTTRKLELPDWWICAGFVRSKIWDVLHGYKRRTAIPDVDVIYYDKENCDELVEKKVEEKLNFLMPKIPWSVKNQARMHLKNNLPPYTNSIDGISKFPETATSLGVRLDGKDNIILAAPWGIEDVIKMEVRPTPYFIENKELLKIYADRMSQKDWIKNWGKIVVNDY